MFDDSLMLIDNNETNGLIINIDAYNVYGVLDVSIDGQLYKSFETSDPNGRVSTKIFIDQNTVENLYWHKLVSFNAHTNSFIQSVTFNDQAQQDGFTFYTGGTVVSRWGFYIGGTDLTVPPQQRRQWVADVYIDIN